MRILKKDNIKVFILFFVIVVLLEIVMLGIITNMQYEINVVKNNKVISEMVGIIKRDYPEVDEKEIIELLNREDTNADELLNKYGIDVNEVNSMTAISNNQKQTILINSVVLIFSSVCIFVLFSLYLDYREKKLKEITKYIQAINNKQYALNIDEHTEGELSKLQSELYKITVMLKEDAENSGKEKDMLAESVSNISHQLKTPLTSISIMLDNIIEDEDMPEEIKLKFIKEINKQVEWMKWLVITLLKFSKLDANAVELKKEEIDVEKLIKKVCENMSIPLEVKNQEIVTKVMPNTTLIGDFNWEAEALTNIVKNCIEHTPEGKKIYIDCEFNNLYNVITIRDEGVGIDKSDLPYIFNRFYKGKNSTNESIGIGLALAKTIIEKDDGMINCTSELNKGTIFEIKYMKYL